MSAMSDYLESAFLNAIFRNIAYTSPSAVYLALYTTDPTDAGTGTEVSGTNYARQAVTFGTPGAASPDGRSVSNSATVTFPAAGAGGWGTVTHWGIHDALSGGNLLFHGSLSASKVVSQNVQVTVGSGDLTVRVHNAASTYIADAWLNAVLRNVGYASPANRYLALYTTDPGADNSGTEASGTNYARQAISFNAPIDDSIAKRVDQASTINFPAAGSSWGTVTHFGILDALTVGNLLARIPADSSFAVATSDAPVFEAGAVKLKAQ